MKTLLNPNAPWPDPQKVEKKEPKKVSPRKPREKVKLVFSCDNVDFFADTHDQLLFPKKGKGNRNAGKNFKKFSPQSS